jgi:hypothetical protein
MLQDKYDDFDIPIDYGYLVNSALCFFNHHCLIHYFVHLDFLPLLISICNKNDNCKKDVFNFLKKVSEGFKNDETNNEVIDSLIVSIHSFTLPIFTHLKSLNLSSPELTSKNEDEISLCSILCDTLANLLERLKCISLFSR